MVSYYWKSDGKIKWEIIHMPKGFIDFKTLMDRKDGQETITNVFTKKITRLWNSIL